MFKLIRDNVPELMKQSGALCNYAVAENQELYLALLRNKLIEEVNEFLETNLVEELVDIVTVVKTLLATNDISEEQFEELYKNKLETNGGFDKKLIGFFPDKAPVSKKDKAE
jgi:predicted house-cleaning noncanonical NTP pyrophosphatase (MazG superfamily)